MRECKILEAENGYIIEHQEEAEVDGVFETRRRVIEDETEDGKKVMIDLLFAIADFFGYQYDKYGKENLKISMDELGHKMAEE